MSTGCTAGRSFDYDIIIRGGTVYDGGGQAPYIGDVGIAGDRIAALGDLHAARANLEIDAAGLAVCPGFINMLSWANESLIADGRSQSDIRQGVTLEVLGEGRSMGPLTEQMKADMRREQGDLKYSVEWTTLGEYLEYLEQRGVSTNVASFVGAGTLRINVIGYEDRPACPDELERMCSLAEQAMQEGAVGVSTALQYVPACFAPTDELIALARVSARHNGMFIAHIRSEGNALLPAVEEFISVVRAAGVRGEIYHLKASGQANWPKLEQVVAQIEAARASGLQITADMYTYTAAATGLDGAMPPWVREGGDRDWIKRLKDPEIRRRLAAEMITPTDEWENTYLAAGTPENVLLVEFKNPALKPLTGRTLAEVAAERGHSPEETAMDLVVENDGDVGTVYFVMSEGNVRRKIKLPWMSFCSDGGSLSAEGAFLRSNPHPRSYGSFARLLGRYVREEQLIPLEEAIRRLTSFPAENLRLGDRGRLDRGYYADVVLFDPARIADHATFAHPHQYATGVQHVLVNGVPVIRNGEHTGARPGRAVRGPGWVGRTTKLLADEAPR